MALLTRIYFNAILGGLGGLLGWMIYGIFGVKNVPDGYDYVYALLTGFIVGGFVAYLVVSVDAIRDQSLVRFVRLSSYGAILGSLGGALGGVIGLAISTFINQFMKVEEQQAVLRLMIEMIARGIGWTFLGVAIGISEGIAARSLGKFSYGAIGGALGGLIGGILFGFFAGIFRGPQSATYFWQALGCVIMGACIGSLTALVKGVFQPASVKVMRGWQEGREYPLDKMATLLGRDEHADIALFRDMKVEKQHAFIRRLGKRYVLFNNNSPPENTLVNDVPVHQVIDLHDGDRIQLGKIILKFQTRAAENRVRQPRRVAPTQQPMPTGPAVAAGSQHIQQGQPGQSGHVRR